MPSDRVGADMRRSRFFHASALAAALALAGAAGMVAAQDDGDKIDMNEPIDASGSYQVDNVDVDVSGPDAESARIAGWKLAQRKAYQMLSSKFGGGGGVPADSVLDSMVTGIVIQNEQIGPNRYIAKLGVLFSRARLGGLMGAVGDISRSAPMLVIPVQWSGGSAVAFEHMEGHALRALGTHPGQAAQRLDQFQQQRRTDTHVRTAARSPAAGSCRW